MNAKRNSRGTVLRKSKDCLAITSGNDHEFEMDCATLAHGKLDLCVQPAGDQPKNLKRKGLCLNSGPTPGSKAPEGLEAAEQEIQALLTKGYQQVLWGTQAFEKFLEELP